MNKWINKLMKKGRYLSQPLILGEETLLVK